MKRSLTTIIVALCAIHTFACAVYVTPTQPQQPQEQALLSVAVPSQYDYDLDGPEPEHGTVQVFDDGSYVKVCEREDVCIYEYSSQSRDFYQEYHKDTGELLEQDSGKAGPQLNYTQVLTEPIIREETEGSVRTVYIENCSFSIKDNYITEMHKIDANGNTLDFYFRNFRTEHSPLDISKFDKDGKDLPK